MFCGHCGKQLSEGLKFCPACGKATDADMHPATTATHPVITTAPQAQQTAIPKEKSGLQKTILIIVIAAVVIGIGALAVWGITRIGSGVVGMIAGEPENGNNSGTVLRVGKTTYFVSNDSERKTSQILKVDDEDGAKTQEVYRMSYSYDGYGWITLLYEKDGVLYFSENSSVYGTYRSRQYCDLMSLNLKDEGSKPTKIEVHLKLGTSIPDRYLQAYEDNYDSKFSLDSVFSYSTLVDKNYLYSYIANGEFYNKALLFRLDCTNGEVVCIEGDPLGLKESWNITFVRGGYAYFILFDYGLPFGLNRASLTNLKQEFLLETSDDGWFSYIRVSDDSLYYVLGSYTSSQSSYELHCLDLNSKEDIVIFESSAVIQYNVVGDTVYYFDGGDLRSCDLDGSNDKLLIRERDDNNRGTIYISGEWIYYRQGSDLYRVRPNDEDFPTRSLD